MQLRTRSSQLLSKAAKILRNSTTQRTLVIAAILLVAATFPASATPLPSDSFGWINTVKGWILGPLGISLGTIGAVGACVLVAVTQGRGIGVLFWVFVGMGLAFGMPNIISLFFPSAGSSGFLLS